MGKVNDYISSLDKGGPIDPVVLASTVLQLHNEEMEAAEGKIASLELEKTKFVSDIAERDGQITGLKAKNWDLANRIPAGNSSEDVAQDENNNPGNESFDDFFEESK